MEFEFGNIKQIGMYNIIKFLTWMVLKLKYQVFVNKKECCTYPLWLQFKQCEALLYTDTA